MPGPGHARTVAAEAAVVAVAAAVLLAGWLVRLDPEGWFGGDPAEPTLDGTRYLEMVDHLEPCNQQPFCRRILVPLVVRALPVSASAGFWITTVAGLVATTVVVYVIARTGGRPVRLALAATLLFLTMPQAAKYFVGDPWRVDPVYWFLLALALLIVLRYDWRWLLPVMAAAVLVRENAVLLVVLLYGLMARSLVDRRAAARVGAVAAVGIGTYAAVRLALPAERGPDLGDVFEQYRERSFRRLWPPDRGAAEEASRILVGPWSPSTVVLAALGSWRAPRLALRVAPYLVLVTLQFLIAGNIERAVFMGFPAVLLLVLAGLDDMDRWGGTPVVAAFVLVPLVATFVLGPVETSLDALALETAALVLLAGTATLLASPHPTRSGA